MGVPKTGPKHVCPASRLRSARRGASVACLAILHVAFAGLALAADAPPRPPPPGSPPAGSAPGAIASPAPTPAATSAEAAAAEQAANEARQATTMQIVPESVPVDTPPPGLLYRLSGVCKPNPCLNPFLRDTDLRLHFRSFYMDRHNVDESINEAWAVGGWLQYTSGWLGNVFQIGATGYTSQPAYAPEEHDGTSLLAPGQEEITILGRAWAALRWKEYATLTGYRQMVNSGYVNPQDNRMIPNCFEGVTVRGELGEFAYDAGYLWDMKPRNSDEFIPMAEQAGADSDEGLWYGALTWSPNDCWDVYAGDYYTPDVFNTAFFQGVHSRPLNGCLDADFGVQYTDQRSIGDEDLGTFSTWNAGLGARLSWSHGLTIGVAAHATGEDANIRSPYGTWPGWLSMIETDFDRANEKALGVAVKYDFGKSRRLHVPGLRATFAYVRGIDREDGSGGELPDTTELDLDLTYDVQKVKGLQLRLRNAYVESGGPDTGYQVRFLVNWEIDLL
jgi:hypothetical protein